MPGIVKKLKIWHIRMKHTMPKHYYDLFPTSNLAIHLPKLKAEQARLAKEIIILEEELGINH